MNEGNIAAAKGEPVVGESTDAVKRVIDAFERSDWREIDVRSGELRVHLSTTNGSSPSSTAEVDDGGGDHSVAEPTDATQPDPQPAIPDGAHVVRAPSPGIFWRSPEPGAPPFADVGQEVESSSTVCIVEVMKLMNHLKAGVNGTILTVYGSNGVAVDQGEPLFAIATDGSPE